MAFRFLRRLWSEIPNCSPDLQIRNLLKQCLGKNVDFFKEIVKKFDKKTYNKQKTDASPLYRLILALYQT